MMQAERGLTSSSVTEASMMEMGTERNGGRSGWGWLEAWSLTSMWCCYLYQHMGPMEARYVYGALFLGAIFIAWGLRENPTSLFQRQRLSGCQGNRDCFAAEAVLMVSFTLFLFFFGMFLSTVYTRYVHDVRSSWHSKCWVTKIVLLASCFIFSIFAPASMTQLYGKFAPFGAGLFLIIQLISVIRCITQLSSRWCGQVNFQNHHCKVKSISGLAAFCSIVGIILMFLWFARSCKLNIALIFTTLLLVYIMLVISAFTKAKGFYMGPLLMGVYIVFLCWSAIKSEPKTSICYTGSDVKWLTIISFIAGLISVTVAAFSTGSDYNIQFTNVIESENDVPYGYGFFHVVFAAGSMYFGMLFLGWDTHHVSERWSMDVGWTSTIVHIVNEGLAVIFFVVVVLARCSGIGWLQQLTGKIFGTGGQQLADESRDIELARFGTDNNGLPREPPATDEHHEGRTETGDDRPPQQDPSLVTEREGGTETDINRDNASSSFSTIGPLDTLEPQAPELGRQCAEFREHW